MKVRFADRPHVVGVAREVGLGAVQTIVVRHDDPELGLDQCVPSTELEVYLTKRRAWKSLPQAQNDEEVAVAIDLVGSRGELYEPTGDEFYDG